MFHETGGKGTRRNQGENQKARGVDIYKAADCVQSEKKGGVRNHRQLDVDGCEHFQTRGRLPSRYERSEGREKIIFDLIFGRPYAILRWGGRVYRSRRGGKKNPCCHTETLEVTDEVVVNQE